MKTLDQIAIEYQTDKATQFTRTYANPHGYTPHYDRVLTPIRDKPIALLEIGVGGGESVQTWLEYLTNPYAHVYGVDIVENTNPWNTPGADTNPRYTFCQGNQSCTTFWACFLATYGEGDWDVIIDDGSHIASHIITTFNALWPNVRPGGLYAIEDLNEAPEAEVWLRGLLPTIHKSEGDFDSITFSKELAILRKRE